MTNSTHPDPTDARACGTVRRHRGRSWTDAEEQIIITRRQADDPMEDIAAALNRSVASVLTRLTLIRARGVEVERLRQGQPRRREALCVHVTPATLVALKSHCAATGISQGKAVDAAVAMLADPLPAGPGLS